MRILPYLYGVSVTLYPTTLGAKPWEGFAINTQPVNDYVVPGTVAAAEEYNWLHNYETNAISKLNDMAGQISAMNWKTMLPLTGLNGPAGAVGMNQPPAWDPYVGRWIMAVDAGASVTPRYQVHESYDGYDWVRLNGSTSLSHAVDGIAVLPNGTICMLEYGAVNTDIIAPGAVVSGAHTYTGTGGTVRGTSAICSFGTKFISAYNLSSGSTPVLKYSTDGITWTTCTGTFAAMTSGAGGAFFLGPTMIVFATFDGSHYYTSPDGVTWTQYSNGNGYYGFSWDALRNQWVAISTGGYWITTDLVNFTQIKAFVNMIPSWIIAADGVVLMAMTSYHNSKNRVVVSTDGGFTWGGTQLGLSTDDQPMISWANGQFAYLDGSNYSSSSCLGLPTPVTLS